MQWFGDLVTCDYWGELWLNEGFATYFENYGATAARPEYRFFDTFFADQTSYGQLVDAKNVSTHALATIDGMWQACIIYCRRKISSHCICTHMQAHCQMQCLHTWSGHQ